MIDPALLAAVPALADNDQLAALNPDLMIDNRSIKDMEATLAMKSILTVSGAPVAGKKGPKRSRVGKDMASGVASPAKPRQRRHDALVGRLVDLLHVYQYKVAGFRPARTKDGWRTPCLADAKGFPDLIAFRHGLRGRRIAIEAKIRPDTLRPGQRDWLKELEACGFEVYEVTSENEEEMQEVLD